MGCDGSGIVKEKQETEISYVCPGCLTCQNPEHTLASELYHMSKHEPESGKGIERIQAALKEVEKRGAYKIVRAVENAIPKGGTDSYTAGVQHAYNAARAAANITP